VLYCVKHLLLKKKIHFTYLFESVIKRTIVVV